MPLAWPVLPTCSALTVPPTNYVRYLLSLLTHLPPTQPASPFPCREESLKEQRHLLSSLPLPQCSNHINIPRSCSHQGDPTPSGWLLSSPDLAATAHTAAHCCFFGRQQGWPFPLLPPSFLALSAWLILPTCHFCSAPGLKSPPLTHASKSACYLYLGALRSPSFSSDLSPELWASSNVHLVMATVISVLILDSLPTSWTPNCDLTGKPES